MRVLLHRQCVFCGGYIARIERGQSAEAVSSARVESQLIHAVRESSQSFSWIRESCIVICVFWHGLLACFIFAAALSGHEVAQTSDPE